MFSGNYKQAVDGKRVFIIGGDTLTTALFSHFGAIILKAPKFADILVFTGGEDVSPELYGEKAHSTTMPNIERDLHEELLFRLGKNKMKIGICRGAQFLNVMNGGKLWQDVEGHALSREDTHMVQYVNVTGLSNYLSVSSTHHQQMIPNPKSRYIKLAWANCSTKKATANSWFNPRKGQAEDPEVVWYPETRSLCFQPHPEYPGFFNTQTRDLFLDCIHRCR